MGDALLEACEGNLDLAFGRNYQYLIYCKELAELILEEQSRNRPNLKVSNELKAMIQFIVDAINIDVGNKPEFEEVPDDEMIVRNWEIFPAKPIIRRMVMYEQDRLNRTQITKQMKITSQEATQTVEKDEFSQSGIKCVNHHASLLGLTPGKSCTTNFQSTLVYISKEHMYIIVLVISGLFVFLCIHRIYLSKYLI